MRGIEQFDEITVYGARGTSEMFVTSLNEIWQDRMRIRAFVDDIDHGYDHPRLGAPVISGAERLALYPDLPVLMAVADPAVRARLCERLVTEGAHFATASFPDLPIVSPDVVFGPGCIASPFGRIGPNVVIGKAVLALSTLLAHDITIGDFTTIGVNATVLGHVEIGSGVTIAPKAIICNGNRIKPLRIGDGAIVGVGAVVARDVPAGARVIGNPAIDVRDWKRLRRLLDAQGEAPGGSA